MALTREVLLVHRKIINERVPTYRTYLTLCMVKIGQRKIALLRVCCLRTFRLPALLRRSSRSAVSTTRTSLARPTHHRVFHRPRCLLLLRKPWAEATSRACPRNPCRLVIVSLRRQVCEEDQLWLNRTCTWSRPLLSK